MRRLLVIAVVAAVPLFAASVRAANDAGGEGGGAPLAYPNLAMAPLREVYFALTANGGKQLRFSTTIVNVGTGPFDLVGSRTSDRDGFAVRQRVFADDGSAEVVDTRATLVYGGDGHDHWHVADLESYELRRLDGHGAVRYEGARELPTLVKAGFCFFDTGPELALDGMPEEPVYSSEGCGDESSLSLGMGLSVGWGDVYHWTLPDQYIDVSRLESGRYRLSATADPEDWFVESDESDNATWVDFAIGTEDGAETFDILAIGASALGPGEEVVGDEEEEPPPEDGP